MPPRLRADLRCFQDVLPESNEFIARGSRVRRASALTIVPTASSGCPERLISSILTYPASQPPSYRRPDDRRSQLHRQYTSLLRSTPMMLLFQHNSLTATELASLRRELTAALRRVDNTNPEQRGMADTVRLQIIRGGVFGAALRVVEFYQPDSQRIISTTDLHVQSTNDKPDDTGSNTTAMYTHALSRFVYEAVVDRRLEHALTPLLSGPLAVLSFPGVSAEHLKAALSVLAPKSPNFPAPTRRGNPSYWEASVQLAVQKLMLLGARIEGRVFDADGARLVGGIKGGLCGVRSQLVAVLQGAGSAVTSTLETAGRSLFFTVEGQRDLLEEESRSTNKA